MSVFRLVAVRAYATVLSPSVVCLSVCMTYVL